MFADPQTITVNGVAKTLAKIESKGLMTVYESNDQTFKLTISHQVMNNDRVKTMARVDQRAVVEHPLTAELDYDTMSEWYVIERPTFGFALTDIQYLATGFKSWLDNTAIAKLFGKES